MNSRQALQAKVVLSFGSSIGLDGLDELLSWGLWFSHEKRGPIGPLEFLSTGSLDLDEGLVDELEAAVGLIANNEQVVSRLTVSSGGADQGVDVVSGFDDVAAIS